MTNKSGADLRATAATIIELVVEQGRSLKSVLAQHIDRFEDSRDRALLESICFNASRHYRRYQWIFSSWLAKPLPKNASLPRALFAVGLAQIDEMKLPPHAAVATTIDAAKILRQHKYSGLLNALLRRALRDGLPASPYLAVQSSHPDWLYTALHKDWPEDLAAILEQNNQAAPMAVRVNSTVSTRAEFVRDCADAGVDVIAHECANEAVIVQQRISPTVLPGWDRGSVAVQDISAQLAVQAMGDLQGMRVLDACAAPGGKTMQLLAQQGTHVVALDVDAHRLERVAQSVQRLHLDSTRLHLLAADAAQPDQWFDGQLFDAVLLDAPCSATGIIRRQPDIKWHRSAEDVQKLCSIQAQLLTALWKTLKPGGLMLYSTCSVLRAENAEQIRQFCQSHGDALLEPLPEMFGRDCQWGSQRLPGEDFGDGFFYARLRKAEQNSR